MSASADKKELSKTATVTALDRTSSQHGLGSVKDWTGEEERRVRLKCDLVLIPILGIAFFALVMDRSNISTALTSTLAKDLGIDNNQINVGSQLLSAGIVVLEIPSNVMMQIAGPHAWLSGQVLLWSLVATFQAFMKTYPQYLATRLLLGLLESGFNPGAFVRTNLFFVGNMLAGACSPLVGAAFLNLDGKGGLAGWQWLFLVEGLIGFTIGIIFLLVLPPYVGNGASLITFNKWSYFTPRESYIIRARVLLDDQSKAEGHIKITWSSIISALSKPKVWMHFLISLAGLASTTALNSYTPTIIKGMGYSRTKANQMASVPLFCGIFYTLAIAFVSDKTGRRDLGVLFTITWSLISLSCLTTLPSTAKHMQKYAVLCVQNTSYVAIHTLNVAWLSVTCTTPQERSVSLALIIMAANCAGIGAGQIFRVDDAPKYHRALQVETSLAAGTWSLVLCLAGWYYMSKNKKVEAMKREEGNEAVGEKM